MISCFFEKTEMKVFAFQEYYSSRHGKIRKRKKNLPCSNRMNHICYSCHFDPTSSILNSIMMSQTFVKIFGNIAKMDVYQADQK